MNEPQLFVLGTSQKTAPVAVREQLHVDLDEIFAALDRVVDETGLLEEAVPLVTCGRLEIYGISEDPERAAGLLLRLLRTRTGASRGEVDEHVFLHLGAAATRHLFRVAAGLDSVVHGEAQILGQVRSAALDERAGTLRGAVLHRLFESALSTGKRVRSETGIGHGAASLASAGLRLVHHELGSLENRTVVIVGAGSTAALVARLLAKERVGELRIVNRTLSTAEEIAAEVGGVALPLSELPAAVADADVVVGAASSPEPLLHGDDVGPRRARPLHLLDLAHPRNFALELGDLEGVRLFDLQKVFERVEAARAARAAEVPRAEAIVDQKVEDFSAWLRSRRGVDVLRAVRAHVLDLARAQADRFAAGRSEEEREEMQRLARSVARSLLHPPTLALRRADPLDDEGRTLLDLAPALFGVGAHDPTGSDPR